MKALWALPAVLLLAFAAVPAAHAAWADDPERVMDDCSDSDLPDEVVNYCLKQVHRLNETNPTADSTALEAKLRRRSDDVLPNRDSYPTPPPRRDDADADEPPVDDRDANRPADTEEDTVPPPAKSHKDDVTSSELPPPKPHN